MFGKQQNTAGDAHTDTLPAMADTLAGVIRELGAEASFWDGCAAGSLYLADTEAAADVAELFTELQVAAEAYLATVQGAWETLCEWEREAGWAVI